MDEDDAVLEAGEALPVAGVGESVVDDDRVVRVRAGPVADEIRTYEAGASGHQQMHGPRSYGAGVYPRHAWSRLLASSGERVGGDVDDVARRDSVRRPDAVSTRRWPSSEIPQALPVKDPECSSTRDLPAERRTPCPVLIDLSSATRPAGAARRCVGQDAPERPSRSRSQSLVAPDGLSWSL